MNDDIVTRLMVLAHHAKKLAEVENLHDLHREAFTRCEDLTWQAANEIKRLRTENTELLGDSEQLRVERDKAWLEKGRIMNEIDCRIEHGADSNGHLEAIRNLFKETH